MWHFIQALVGGGHVQREFCWAIVGLKTCCCELDSGKTCPGHVHVWSKISGSFKAVQLELGCAHGFVFPGPSLPYLDSPRHSLLMGLGTSYIPLKRQQVMRPQSTIPGLVMP